MTTRPERPEAQLQMKNVKEKKKRSRTCPYFDTFETINASAILVHSSSHLSVFSSTRTHQNNIQTSRNTPDAFCVYRLPKPRGQSHITTPSKRQATHPKRRAGPPSQPWAPPPHAAEDPDAVKRSCSNEERQRTVTAVRFKR